MALAEFNRNNPFVIMCRYKATDIKNAIVTVIKEQIYTGVTLCVTLIVLISNICNSYSIEWISLLSIILILFFTSSIFLFKKILNDSVHNEINSILYGNEYSIINIDNERLMDILLKCNLILGKLEHQKLLLKYQRICNMILIILFLLKIFLL